MCAQQAVLDDVDGDVVTPPSREPAGHAVVFGGWAVGGGWLTAYDFWRLGDGSGATHRVRLDRRRLHPRLVLPYGILLWALGEAQTLAKAARLASHLTPQSATERIASRPVELPLPCAGGGRCPVQVHDGELRRTGSGTAEEVAAALLHRGQCSWATTISREAMPDWAGFWIKDRRASVGELALRTAAALQRSDERDLPAVLEQLAGGRTDETALRQAYQARRSADRFRQGFGGYKRLTHYRSRGLCSSCSADFYPATGACANCRAYPLGPDRRSSALDRLERELGVDHPALIG